MNPTERKVYDDYPALLLNLLQWADVANRLPLDGMLTVIDRMALTSAYIGPEQTRRIAPQILGTHRELVALCRQFRADYLAILARTRDDA